MTTPYRQGDRVHIAATVVAGERLSLGAEHMVPCLKVSLGTGIDDIPIADVEVVTHLTLFAVGDRVKIIGKDRIGTVIAIAPDGITPQCWVQIDGEWSLTTYQPCQLIRL